MTKLTSGILQDHDNVYNLWDAEVGFSCLCEPGYSGPTCASKMCKYGIDPLYYDDDVMAADAVTGGSLAPSASVYAAAIDIVREVAKGHPQSDRSRLLLLSLIHI